MNSEPEIIFYSHKKSRRESREGWKDDSETKMLEDLIYEILPVIGFGIISISIFIIIVMRKCEKSLMFCLFFAISDLLTGIAVIINGFYGVIVTIYGSSIEQIQPINCFYRAPHITILIFTDYLHLLILCCFTIDRFIQILVPVSYGRICEVLINWKLFAFLSICAIFPSVPAFQFAVEAHENVTIRIGSHCRFDEVVGDSFYLSHILKIQWIPIACLGTLSSTLLIYIIRQSKHKWSYNWSEEIGTTKQLFGTIFMRCFLSGLSVHIPLLLISRTTQGHQMLLLKDYLIRISYWIFVIIFQPIWYLMILTKFQQNVNLLFNKYSDNTQRNWQSADDPPVEGGAAHLDRHGSPNPFGSWYSMTGNIAGEAGVPVGNQRSVSFYYDN
ncbi:unnamed protein product [Caenorhabditis angaria]|uniref:G-protein coupled receptors family 1 profile domain-containing protein n=1 Tax=Caenorhabditis angaria TaxID=860376 RepID=A0A9P1IP97_9PELO|nr:unnamed protein product [Caenorhabditis angaria]